MNTSPQHSMSAPARPSNAYTPTPAAAKRRPMGASPIEAPPEALSEAIPIFKVGYRKVLSTTIVFPDRRVRLVTPKLAGLETISDNQELLLQFSDPKEAQRQPLRAIREVMGVMRDIVPFMVPDEADREFLLGKFDDEQVEETELITAILKAFGYIMGSVSGAKAVAVPAAPEPAEAPAEAEAPTEAEEFHPTAAAEDDQDGGPVESVEAA